MKEKIKIIKKYGKYVALLLILAITSIVIFNTNNKAEVEEDIVLSALVEEEKEVNEETEEQETIKTEEKIKVDIKGEVITPGVYELNIGDRVSDAIKTSGGLTKNADTTLINLSKNLKDEMVIIIYNKNEIEKLKQELTTTKTVIEYIEKECTCPDTINDACIYENNKENNSENSSEKTVEETQNTKISINTAPQEELENIPGIGASKAKAIIKYREENGGFKTIEEIINVSGIGESTFEKFKDYITI